jgi:biopolymer transport protein ExbB/TolQ
MNNKSINFLISVFVAMLLGALLYFWYSSSTPGSTSRLIAELLGGNMPHGIIQMMTYALFTYAMLDIFRLKSEINQQSFSLKLNLLPEKEQYVLSPDDVNEIKLKMVELEKSNPTLLIDLIKKACTKFRANKSVSEALHVVNTQTEINSKRFDSELNLIKYMGWAVQTLGLVGTVMGLTFALSYAGEIVTQAGISKVTSYLGSAFSTTLVSVALSIILMYFFTILQNQNDKLHTDNESYVLENLINRIYNR